MSSRSAYIYGISAVLLWSTVASAFKLTLGYMDFVSMLFFASLSSLGALFLILILQGKLGFIRSLSRKDHVRYALFGLLNPFVYYLVLFRAYELLPAQQAQPLNYTWQIVLSVMSVLILKQKMGWKNALGIGISFLGILVISGQGSIGFSNPLGVTLALGSALIWASFWLLNLKDSRDAVEKLFMCFLFGSIYISALFLMAGHGMPEPWGIAGAIYVGLFEMGITFVLWLRALEKSDRTSQVSMLIYLSPFISFIIIHLTVGEEILAPTIVGTVLLIAGIVIGNLDRSERNER